jgi:hypothetical protein
LDDLDIIINGNFGGLKAFQEMKYLTAPLPFLMGFVPDSRRKLSDALPQSLRSFDIADDLMTYERSVWDGESVAALLEDFLENWETHTPDLEDVNVYVRDVSVMRRWTQDVRDRLAALPIKCAPHLDVKIH